MKALEAAEASSQIALDANRLGYQVGVRINIDVLNSQSQLFQTKRDLALARYNVLVGNLRLRQANGTLTPEDLRTINATLATNGRAAVDSTGPAPASTQLPAATPSTAPAAPMPAPTPIPVVPPVQTPPFTPQPPVMPSPPPQPEIVLPPSR